MIVAGLLVLTTTARAQMVYDLGNDWNSTSDSTSNVWAYGVLTTPQSPGSFSIPSGTNFNVSYIPGIQIWFLEPGLGHPNIEKNVTSSPIA